jgi:hypothetical protein
MRRQSISKLVLMLAVATLTAGTLTLLQPAIAGGTTCLTKHCPANTHCCTGCTGGVICAKNGAPCPECAPQ